MNLYLLIDHNDIYGSEKNLNDAYELIKNIPSVTLINYISGFSAQLYLNDNSVESGKIQANLIDSLLSKAGKESINRWVATITKQAEKGNAPLLIWEYSNLKFYTLIFNNFNNLPTRDLTNEEARKVYDAYLIVNALVNSKPDVENLKKQAKNFEEHIEDLTIPTFIYQKDYSSTLDFSNQVTRGVLFFKYLESHPVFCKVISDYYKTKNVQGYLRMFRNLMILFTELGIGPNEKRKQIADLEEYCKVKIVDLEYINTLCINDEVSTYQEDESFSKLREKFLYRFNDYRFFILNVNFLIDQFYKAQVFSFNNFLKKNNIENDFLSIKGKEFMEEIYLPKVIASCFPSYIKYFGKEAVNSNGEELCDMYFRSANRVCLMEFKDVLLNAKIKNQQDKKSLFNEFEKKFVKNQRNRPKGITQLVNAIKDIIHNSVLFDEEIPIQQIEFFPVILYTDFTFGVEGLNKIYKEKFQDEIQKLQLKNIVIHDVTFINLSYLELHEDYLANGVLNFFDLIIGFHNHIKDPNYKLTPFEVYSRFYMNKYIKENYGLPNTYQELLKEIVQA